MEAKVLKNSPLIEVIFEMRWELVEIAPMQLIDPNYKLMLGQLFERLKDTYPYYEQLPASSIPDEAAMYIVQHRFRRDKDKWPLVQVGPGIVTLNNVEQYSWPDFEKRILQLISALFDAYSNTDFELRPSSLLLRYINGVELEGGEDIISFLNQNFRMNINIDEKIFSKTSVSNLPLGADLRFYFPCEQPKGTVNLRFAKGKKDNKDSLIWELQMQGINDVMKNQEEITQWCAQAHEILEQTFFGMLQEVFLGRLE